MKGRYRSVHVHCYFLKITFRMKRGYGVILNEWGMIYVQWYFKKLIFSMKNVL